MKTALLFFHLVLLICISPAALAQESVDESARLKELVHNLDAGIEQVRTLDAQLGSVPEMDAEAIMFRRDERTFDLLKDLDELARSVAKLPPDDALRKQLTQRLRNESGPVAELIFKRTDELSHRIAKLSGQMEEASGTEKLVMEAYILSLENLRIQAYQSAGDLIEGCRALGLPAEKMVKALAGQLYLRAETLVGRLEFTGAAGEQLKEILATDPQNTELDAEVKGLAHQHAVAMNRLQSVSDLLARFELDNSMYKSVLLQQGQDLSVRDFDVDVFFTLLQDGWEDLRASLIEKSPDALFNLLVFVLLLLAFRALSRLVRRAVKAACERSGADMSTLLKEVLASVSGAAVLVVGILIALSQLGISLGPMLAGLGVAGFIVGFALQDTLGNFAAGGMILLYRPYDVDDFVEVTGASGLVKKMSLVSTTITTFDNQTLVVPNSKIWGDVIKNVTAQKLRRVDMKFGIGYADDVEKAEHTLRDIVEQHELVLDSPEPMIRLHELGDSSVNFVVRPWVKTADYWAVYWDITREVKMRFDREGISIPFPQRDVHLYAEAIESAEEEAQAHADEPKATASEDRSHA